MARKHGMLRAALTLGGLAALGTAVYRNRDLIRTFFSEASGTFTPEEPADYDSMAAQFPEEEAPAGDEPVIVIDQSADVRETE